MFKIRLKELRIGKDLTQKQLADILHMQNTAISKYELGERKPDQETLIKIAEYFNVSLDYLMGASEIRNPYKNKEENLDEVDKLLLDLKKGAKERGIAFDGNSADDLLDFLEFLENRKDK